jgi:hypothetical protein
MTQRIRHYMYVQTKRQDKRQSAKKSREHSVYTQKAVRAKEALIEKKVLCTPPHPIKH